MTCMLGLLAVKTAAPEAVGVLPTNTKCAPTSVELVVAAESSYQQTLTDAVGPGLGGDPGFGVRAAGGGTGIGGREHDDPEPAPRHPRPAACSPPPVIRDRAAGGRPRDQARDRGRVCRCQPFQLRGVPVPVAVVAEADRLGGLIYGLLRAESSSR